MQNYPALNPSSTPLMGTTLIEASAGTGKTFTMVSLYLRLLLQLGEGCFSRPLTVDQILLVTYTEASTQELKERVRERVALAKKQLIAYRRDKDINVFYDNKEKKIGKNQILAELVEQIDDLDMAIQRLHIAEQNMDTASIYTIHGFCRRMLNKFAFNSGMNFEMELVTNQDALYLRLVREFWRTYFYSQPKEVAFFIHQYLTTPDYLLKQIRSYLTKSGLDVAFSYPELLSMPFEQFLQDYVLAHQQQVLNLKAQWLACGDEIENLILGEIGKVYGKGVKRRLKRSNFKSNLVPTWLANVRHWAENKTDFNLPEHLTKYFSQQRLRDIYVEDGAEPISHPVFELVDQIKDKEITPAILLNVIYYQAIKWLQQQLALYQEQHKERNFDDLLVQLNHGLQNQETGDQLSHLIRSQYPFAMIDEFQDTDNIQYQIFSKIYLRQADCGFLMIGDPKQAIYKFRGADIFTYLKAVDQAQQRFTLTTNYRSEKNLINLVNQCFNFEPEKALTHSPFLYEKIGFIPVQANPEQRGRFIVNQQVQAPLNLYQGDYSDKQKAQICAQSIQQWLSLAQQGKAGFGELDIQPLQAKNIAVLVRNRYQADLIKQALYQRGVSSVYLSDRSNIFESALGYELILILRACLNPFNERNILNALATQVFAFTSDQILSIKQNEQLLEHWVERFEHYQQVWQRQGVLPMLYRLLLDDINQPSLSERILAGKNGERNLTDFMHFAELLQQASILNESESALLRWFERKIENGEENDEQQIRLESEQELVKIVTIHKSKGLEYDLVWLPFIATGVKQKKQDSLDLYYDYEKKLTRLDLANLHPELEEKERLAEEMRLLYVALTRAKYQLSMILPEQFTQPATNTKREGWNSILYALSQGEIGNKAKLTKPYDTEPLIQQLIQKVGVQNVQVSEFNPDDKQKFNANQELTLYPPAEFTQELENNWLMTSFSGLLLIHQRNQQRWQRSQLAQTGGQKLESFSLFDNALDYDFSANSSAIEQLEQELNAYDPAFFPAGANVGTLLHNWLENYSFSIEPDGEKVQELCEQLNLGEDWLEPTSQWLKHILTTPLIATQAHSFLANIGAKDRLAELQFYLPLKPSFSSQQFNQLLEQYHHLPQQDFLFHLWNDQKQQEIQGMLRGFIDLVFRFEGKYYVLDYKSNLLGPHSESYQEQELQQVMLDHHYDLQYLIYTVALHLYLQKRDPNYDYEQHFGGVIYTFLRGMDGHSRNGIFFDKPEKALIEQLSLYCFGEIESE